MIEELKKEIEVQKEVLSTLPKNNKKNLEKYKDSISGELEKYKSKKEDVLKEMTSRKEAVLSKLPKEKYIDKSESLNKIVAEYHWFSKYNTGYEKMMFDKILYNISKDKITYDDVNKTISNLLSMYKEAGVNLQLNDFTYSPIFYEFMKIFFQNMNDLGNRTISESFEKLYWKESNIITHMELTFKNLYYKYQTNFDKFLYVKQQKLLKEFNDSLIKQYQDLKRLNDNEVINISTVYDMFISKQLNPNDFTKEKIEQVISNYTDVAAFNENVDADIEEFVKLKHTLEEYSCVLKYNYILEDMKKLYDEKDKYKGLVKTKLGEIKKAEKKLDDLSKKVYLLNDEKQAGLGFMYKLTKTAWSSKNKKNKDEIIDKLYMDIDNQIMEIKNLYDEFETDKFNEKLLLFNGNSELISFLKLANSYYIYQDNLIGEQELKTDEVIEEINEFILSPYNNIINNINIENNKDIKQVISDKYELSSINISSDSLEDISNIETIINDINKILYYNVIEKSDLTIEDIIYVYTVSDMLD